MNTSEQLLPLAEKRRRWIDINRENGFEEGIRKLLTELYPSNAHFIYELFQNAEDAGATVVRFTLTEKELEFEHNGKRLFDIKDVESITSIGVSTKRDDNTSIGKFGVGFKAVFAYTNAPEIHSGDFHFCINDLVVPELVKEQSAVGDATTRFIFPFNHANKTKTQAFEEIKEGLLALKPNTLLFLSNISKIEYLFADGSSSDDSFGYLERKTKTDGSDDENIVEILSQTPDKSEPTALYFLRYFKDATVPTGKEEPYRVSIAYALERARQDAETDSKKKRKTTTTEWKIVPPADGGEVSIYFPAEKETSNLKFHIHAPFASTVARDSVRGCDENNQLRDAIAELLVESLEDIKQRGLLTVNFLGVLPIPEDDLSDFYEPIREKVVEAFKDGNNAFVPTKSGEHKNADALYRGPRPITDLIDDDDLFIFTDYGTPLWAANPNQLHQRDDKFLDSLGIEEWGWAQLQRVFNPRLVRRLASGREVENFQEILEKWIASKEDKWLMRLYVLLNELPSRYEIPKWGRAVATDIALVRVVAGKKIKCVPPSSAYFSPSRDAPAVSGIYFVKPEVYNLRKDTDEKFARSFLESIGVEQYDKDVSLRKKVERALERYDENDDDKSVEENLGRHLKDMRLFIRYWKETKDVEILRIKKS
jgi:hypothetical protein